MRNRAKRRAMDKKVSVIHYKNKIKKISKKKNKKTITTVEFAS